MTESWKTEVCNKWGIGEDDIECHNCFHRCQGIRIVSNGNTYYPCVCPEDNAPFVVGSQIDALPMVQSNDECPGFYPGEIIVENPEEWVPYEH